MKALGLKYLARVDALSLRERVFLLLSILAVSLAVVDVVWLTPAQSAYRQARNGFTAQGAELARLRAELQGMAKPVDASKAARDDIAAAQAQLETVNQEIKAKVPAADSGVAMEQALVQFLRKHDGLTLLSTGTVKQEFVAVSATAATPAGASAAVVGLHKRGLELRVSGPYPELVRYVKTLEGALPALRWGALQLKADKQPPELFMQVYVVGVQP